MTKPRMPVAHISAGITGSAMAGPPWSTDSAALTTMTNGNTARLISYGSNSSHAAVQAKGMVYNLVQAQSAMLAFIDNFKMLGVVFLAVIPILLMMKKPRVPAGGVPAH